MAKKKRFELTACVHQELISENEVLYFVSDPSKTITVSRQPNGEFKVIFNKEVTTLHAAAQALLGQEPPGHACRWFRNKAGKTLYELWHAEEEDFAQAA